MLWGLDNIRNSHPIMNKSSFQSIIHMVELKVSRECPILRTFTWFRQSLISVRTKAFEQGKVFLSREVFWAVKVHRDLFAPDFIENNLCQRAATTILRNLDAPPENRKLGTFWKLWFLSNVQKMLSTNQKTWKNHILVRKFISDFFCKLPL